MTTMELVSLGNSLKRVANGLDVQKSILGGGRNFSLCLPVHTSSGADLASSPMGIVERKGISPGVMRTEHEVYTPLIECLG
jgi:hypothetical protein